MDVFSRRGRGERNRGNRQKFSSGHVLGPMLCVAISHLFSHQC